MFGLKAWVNPFKKMSTVRLFERLVFKGYKGVFFALEYRKRNFPSLYCLKKKSWKNGHFGKNHGLNSLEKCQFFGFLNFFPYSLEKRFLL